MRLADYIIANVGEVVQSTINQVCANSGASYATIIRFCKRLGYSGFKELKDNLFFDTQENNPVTDLGAGYRIERNDTTDHIIQKAFRSSIHTLQESNKIINRSEVERACDSILKANTVYFIGTGISGVCAQYAYTRFFRIGINCSFETDPTIYKIRTSIMGKNDVLFAISSSGRSGNVVDAARIARSNQIPVISLCDFAISPLSKLSEINLYTTPRNSTQFLEMDVQLFIAQINIIDIIFFKCCTESDNERIQLLNKTKNYSDKEKI